MSTGIKVKIKCLNERLFTRENLLSSCFNRSLKIESVFRSGNDFTLRFNNSNEAEKIFREPIQGVLQGAHFQPILPPELKAARTVFVSRVDKEILNHSHDQIAHEINQRNEWCSVEEVVKLPKNLKITFSIVEMAEKSTELGISMFYLHIPGCNMNREVFIRLETCFACYAVDNHQTRECPKRVNNPNYEICSKCASTEHDFRRCNV